ncbi:MAG: hypothetical protein QG657_5320 [Acidobacteriota bacterium]|nr:hypothetical protein [Acidobacteriota bacterium]
METLERDQLFCFLDVLGFSNLVKSINLDFLYQKYKELINAAEKQQRDGIFLSSRSGHPFFGYERINSFYFSDTIIFWCPYDVHHLEALATSMKEVMCRSIEIMLPLRGAISVGRARLNLEEKVFIGEPFVKAANAEKVQKWIGITLSNEFREPPFNGGFKADCFLQYDRHLKDGGISQVTPLVIDFPRQWRNTRKRSLVEAIQALNRDPTFSDYYVNTLNFIDFSEKSDRWWESYAGKAEGSI